MAHTAALVETLKRELRARRMTYAQVARHLGVSEVSVKRMFARKEITLARIDRICALAGIEFSDLARQMTVSDAVISQLTEEQEREFVANHRLMLVALCVLNHWSMADIVANYGIPEPECIRLLARLDRLRFIELLPNNRIRLLVSRAFSWIPNGPIQTLFKRTMLEDFFGSPFAGEHEFLLLSNGALSKASLAALKARLRRTAAEFAESRIDDAALPARERVPATLLMAMRPWEPEFLKRYRRAKPAAAPRPVRAGAGSGATVSARR